MPTLVEEQLDNITLYYREGTSDKVYQCAIEAAGTRFVVNFAFGRRGSTLNTGTKTNVPVDWDTAKAIYDKLVREKTAKGYTPGPDGTPYHNSPKAERFTGLLPQLLNPIEEAEMNRLWDSRWGRTLLGNTAAGLFAGSELSLWDSRSPYSSASTQILKLVRRSTRRFPQEAAWFT